MTVRSPYPDIEIPDVWLPEFLFSGRLGARRTPSPSSTGRAAAR